MHEDDAQVGGDEPAPGADLDVVALADVVDVDRDGGVGADPVSERGENRVRNLIEFQAFG